MEKKVEMVILGIRSLMDSLLELSSEADERTQPFVDEAQRFLKKAHHEMFMVGKALPASCPLPMDFSMFTM